MSSIGVTRREDGSYKGQLKTLSIRMAIALAPITAQSEIAERQPDFRIYSEGVEVGAAWFRIRRARGKFLRPAGSP